MKALILAAGKGERLGALTRDRPKPMIPIGGRPLLERHVAWLAAAGVDEIAINLHHQPEVIRNHLGDGHRFGVRITYSLEEQLLGTAGAAARLHSFLDRSFVLVYGDVFTNLSLNRLQAFHLQAAARGALMSLALYRVSNPSQCGLVACDDGGRITRFVEKPPPHEVFTDLAYAGMAIVEPSALDWIPVETVYDFGHDLIPALLARQQPIYGQEIAAHEVLIDIGTPQGLARAEKEAKQSFASAASDRCTCTLP